MVQSVKFSPCKHEELSLTSPPKALHKKPGRSVTPAFVEWTETDGTLKVSHWPV